MIKVSILEDMGKKARAAVHLMARGSSFKKNQALKEIAHFLIEKQEKIMESNEKDVTTARAAGLNEANLDRLSLRGRLEGIAEDMKHVIDLPDPIGEVFDQKILPNGLNLSKQRTPLGVLGIIYEARPNVTVDVAALAIKTGNCAILRGGSETIESNKALLHVIQESLSRAELPVDAIQLIEDPDRSHVLTLLKMNHAIDLIIPRGGAGLHTFCRENSKIPVITGGIGICHLFVDESADQDKALEVIYNAKVQRPTVCNALDTLLVHTALAGTFISRVISKLGLAGVSFRLDTKAMQQVKKSVSSSIYPAQSADWDTEWLALVLGIKIVQNLSEAIAHVHSHSTGHSDGILTENPHNADRFVQEIDSAAVYVNASTRFTDGSQFGLGAEVAISTQKFHARGPMGLKELTSYKWVVRGNYHVRK